jgi:PAS domain S-box-containing protein
VDRAEITPREEPGHLRSRALADALERSDGLGVYVVDGDGALVEMSHAAERMLGWSTRELRGRDMHATIHTPPGEDPQASRESCELLGVLRSGRPVVVDTDTFYAKGGVAMDVTLSSSPVLDEADEIAGAVVIFHESPDRGELRRLREDLAGRWRETSDALQRNLLPGALPTPEYLSLAASLRPAGDGMLLGGDFYDAFPAGDGQMVLIGDVCGKGPEAAALGAMVRFLLRGFLRRDPDLRAAIELVNGELRSHAAARSCTLVLVHLLPREGGGLHVMIARAGHEYPVLVRRDGSVEQVRAEGDLLGAWPIAKLEPVEVLLEDRDSLILYTDGLTERRRDRVLLDVGELMAGGEHRSAQQLVTELEYRAGLLDGAQARDDVAVVVVQAGAPAAIDSQPSAPTGDVPRDPNAIADVESSFRDINERVNEGRPEREEIISVVCECAHTACVELIDIPREAYESIRDSDRCFFVIPGHQVERVEDVLERRERFWVVSKRGEAGIEAERQA